MQERANRELKRRSRVVQIFPSRKSLIRMLETVFAEMNEERASRRWFTENPIVQSYDGQANTPEHSYEGEPEQHAKHIIKLVNPILRKVA